MTPPGSAEHPTAPQAEEAPALEAVEGAPRNTILLLSIFVLSVACMWGCVTGPFLFDDIPLISGNHYVQSFEHWGRWFSGQLWDTNFDPALESETRGFWRPLVQLSYAVDWQLGGGSPLMFHFTNLIVHALNACILFVLLGGWVKDRAAAALGALLFAVHPVQTEPVAWIAGRTDSLCLLGMLLATLGLRQTQRVVRTLLLAVGLVLAFTSKEMAVLFPALAGLELWSRARPALEFSKLRPYLLQVLPFVFLSLFFFAAHRTLVEGAAKASPSGLVTRAALFFEAWGATASCCFGLKI